MMLANVDTRLGLTLSLVSAIPVVIFIFIAERQRLKGN
jgi:hypothetical protein